MTTLKRKRPYAEMRAIADQLVDALRPHCEQLEIAGSLRRRRAEIGDIELVAIPKVSLEPSGLFPEDTCEVNVLWRHLDKWISAPFRRKWGDKYRQFVFQGVQVDLFTAEPGNWGWIFLIRTGSADFSHRMAMALNAHGLTSESGSIISRTSGKRIQTPTEIEVFDLVDQDFVNPEKRT